jgi:hypothetical protein
LTRFATVLPDTRAMVLGPDTGMITYRATFGDRVVFVTTVYARRDGAWQGGPDGAKGSGQPG